METYNKHEKLIFDLAEYNYQEELTKQLDNSSAKSFNQELLNEIVLWKVNRYVDGSDELVKLVNKVDPNAIELDEELTKQILKKLLVTKGIQLALASTILRFRNPNIYQIIDQRAYRFAIGEPLIIPAYSSEVNINKQINIYLVYLKKLRDIANEKSCPFNQLDRILYAYDKKENKDIPIKY